MAFNFLMVTTQNSTPIHLVEDHEKIGLPDMQTLLLILSVLFFISGLGLWVYVNFMMK
jgi:hypothetical protein